MLRGAFLFVLSTASLFSEGQIPLQLPQGGFEQNRGQFSDDVLFALDQRILYRDRIQLAPGVSIKFLTANPSPAVTGEEPRPFPLNRYFGADPKKWLENIPHFKTIRYAQVNPGIDVQFMADWGSPAMRITVLPGADLTQFGISGGRISR